MFLSFVLVQHHCMWHTTLCPGTIATDQAFSNRGWILVLAQGDLACERVLTLCEGMSISVDIALLSGRRCTVVAGLPETVGTLKRQGQIALGVFRGRLLDSAGRVLDASTPIYQVFQF